MFHEAEMENQTRKPTFTDKDIPNFKAFIAHGTEFIIPDRTVAGIPIRKKVTIRGTLIEDFKWSYIKSSFVTFWSQFFTRIWLFFVQALWIPSFRPEWGKYQTWDYTASQRRKKAKRKKRASGNDVLTTNEDLPETKEKHHKKSSKKSVKSLREHQDHDPTGCEILRFNVAGLVYETQRRTIDEYPDTLLGNPERRMRYWDPKRQEYFFDRHRKSFEAILYYFQSRGTLLRPSEITIPVFEDELKFYDIGPSIIAKLLRDEGMPSKSDFPKPIPKNLLLRKIWFLIEYPESSPQAKFAALFSICVVLVSTVIFCLETVPLFSEDQEVTISRLKDPLSLCEAVCAIWFTFEYLVRLISCPERMKFVRTPLNIMDVLSICPFYISLITLSVQDDESMQQRQTATQTLVTLKVFRLFRVFRVFKLSRHSVGLQILGKTLRASMRELGLLTFFLVIGVIVFSSFVYYAEISESSTQFTSIPDAFWWGVVTITSLGYGDQVPKSFAGKIVGSFCAVAAVLTLSLPIPIFVSNFNYYYQRETQEGERREMGTAQQETVNTYKGVRTSLSVPSTSEPENPDG